MILDILNEIAATKGKAKVKVLEKYKTNICLQEVWHMTYSRMNFGTSVVVSLSDGNSEASVNYGAVIALLDKLRCREVTGNAAKSLIAQTLTGLHPDCIEVYNRIIKSNLKCGIGFTAAQNVYGDTLFKKYPVMLISAHCNKKAAKIIADGAVLQLKSDGVRGVAEITREGIVSYFSRSGEVFNGLEKFDPQINAILKRYYWKDPLSEKTNLDGEFVVIDKNGVHQPSQTSGIMKKCIEGTATKEDIDSLTFYVWDMYEDNDGDTYYDRLEDLTDMLKEAAEHITSITLVQSWFVKTLDEVHRIYAEIVKTGNEGVVLKSLKNVWKDTRVTDCIKYKEKHRAEFLITGFYMGDKGGEFQNVLGGYNIKSHCGIVISNTGSGLSYADRGILPVGFAKNNKPIYKKGADGNYPLDPDFNFKEMVDTIISIEYNKRTKSKDGRESYSLRFPIFKQFRDDKSQANTMEEMILEEQSSYGLRT
ncbi:DNA ligase [Colwellia phage 9A]|uniref:DNA ligase n=1 Tax=Colwellia phage 9A TaxID=765765 RepID=I3UMH0_9CAUD|nr:DNA ligase [Colwellia phage 9A]AFK66685.1 DNA ligase [Colwellia phage 9A]